jgi:hypothetical protein
MTDPVFDPFSKFANHFFDETGRRQLEAGDPDDFVERLSEKIEQLPARRRQALMMLLLTLAEGLVEPTDVARWLSERDVTDDRQVDETVVWLRERRRSSPS